MPKLIGGIWPRIVSWPNLLLAARKARRGKRDKHSVQCFEFDLESQLLRIQRELQDGSYRPGPFRTHWIARPKRRLISAAPYRDRVVHHALMNVLEPILERRFHPDSYACRKGKGTHAAADHLQALMRRFSYAVCADVRKFFPSIDHEILKAEFRRTVKDSATLRLMDLIVDGANEQEEVQDWFPDDGLLDTVSRRKGLPIGNLTSQWFANWYLNGLDRLLAAQPGVGGCVRYCDDFVMVGDDKNGLRDALAAGRAWLLTRRLRLHEERLHIRRVTEGVTFVGLRLWPGHRLLRKSNVRAFRRRINWLQEGFSAGRLEWADVRARLAAWLGHARQANTNRLLRKISAHWVFGRPKHPPEVRGTGVRRPAAPDRAVDGRACVKNGSPSCFSKLSGVSCHQLPLVGAPRKSALPSRLQSASQDG